MTMSTKTLSKLEGGYAVVHPWKDKTNTVLFMDFERALSYAVMWKGKIYSLYLGDLAANLPPTIEQNDSTTSSSIPDVAPNPHHEENKN